MIKKQSVTVILLAGGTGNRMKISTPKQFLMIHGKPVSHYSFEIFMAMPEIKEIVVVAQPEYRPLFEQINHEIPLSFALPGARRQDSVFNGLQSIKNPGELICIHDAARPAITVSLVKRVLEAAKAFGAAAPGMPIKFTVKMSNQNGFVEHTPDRSVMWEIQTPQVIRYPLLVEGFQYINHTGQIVTDDVSLVELLQKPVKIVEGNNINVKITTPDDLINIERFLLPDALERVFYGK
jgi:2-C-methyl-D-erythritol 4-phosphate cytidylyltransferase